MSRGQSDGQGDFLGRWSARKLKARTEPEPGHEPAASADPAAATPAAIPEDLPDDEILRRLDLPDPDTLVKGDNFAAFLKAGVPARLRNRALRRLWISDPVLANLDGLNDYDQDFTDAATVVKDLKTAYRVGRGMLRDEEPAEAAIAEPAPDDPLSGDHAANAPEHDDPAPVERARAATSETAASPPAPGELTPDDAADAHRGATPDPLAAAGEHAGPPPPGEGPTPRPPRMRFRFDRG